MRTVLMVAGAGLLLASPLWAGGRRAAGAASPTGAETGNPLAAVWKEQHMSFFYMGRTSRYSCDGLRDKMLAMLLDFGARRDLKVTAVGCEPTSPRARLGTLGPSLSIVFSSPALPDPAAKPLHSGDLTAVDARFEAFTLTSDAFRNLGIADCELVEEFARQILPKLATRGVQQDITCVPYQTSGSRFLVRGEVLRNLAPDAKGPRNLKSP